jgi:Pyruvate/2-oxoacid:ferredoxin oxidoreductase delta subunit
MRRKIVQIDQAKCNGCGLCINACHEGALKLIDGKAQLVTDAYCDGLGACLPKCPVDAIQIVEREAAAFDEAAVLAAQQAAAVPPPPPAPLPCGCPGTMARKLARATPATPAAACTPAAVPSSELRQWPCQIKLVPINAPWFQDAELLVAADCAAYAYANMHREFMAGKITIIGCPKLDSVDYAEKLGAILKTNSIRSLTVLRMEVPCCGGLADAARRAVLASGKHMPCRVVIIGTDGDIVTEA